MNLLRLVLFFFCLVQYCDVILSVIQRTTTRIRFYNRAMYGVYIFASRNVYLWHHIALTAVNHYKQGNLAM